MKRLMFNPTKWRRIPHFVKLSTPSINLPLHHGTRFSTLQTLSAQNEKRTAEQQATRITKIGMFVNFGMAGLKGGAGMASGSTALLADAAHSISDLISDLVTLWVVRIARLPPDRLHPYGYGKYEAVGSLTIGGLLVFAGAGMGIHSFEALDLMRSVADSTSSTPSELGIMAAILSIFSKEALYHATVTVGKNTNSKVLIANAWHHRTDAISSIVALGGILGSKLQFPFLDPLAGVVVSGMIMKTGFQICMESVRELTDECVAYEVLEAVNQVIDDVIAIGDVRARRMGPCTVVDLRVQVDRRMSISAAQQVAARVKHGILFEIPDVSEVLVHIDADCNKEIDNKEIDNRERLRPQKEIKSDVYSAIAKVPEIIDVTHMNVHWIPMERSWGTLIEIEIIVDPDMTVRDAHNVARRARKLVEEISYVSEADIHLELFDEDIYIDDFTKFNEMSNEVSDVMSNEVTNEMSNVVSKEISNEMRRMVEDKKILLLEKPKL